MLTMDIKELISQEIHKSRHSVAIANEVPVI